MRLLARIFLSPTVMLAFGLSCAALSMLATAATYSKQADDLVAEAQENFEKWNACERRNPQPPWQRVTITDGPTKSYTFYLRCGEKHDVSIMWDHPGEP